MLCFFVNQHILSTKLAGLTLANYCARAEPVVIVRERNHAFLADRCARVAPCRVFVNFIDHGSSGRLERPK